uniref:Sec-independent protein translocase protein n=1 Tax=Ophioglossum californicum TaxID=1267209 RepID=A0A1B3TRH2_9MONI|nr:Sec-independent protein translocase protein [Ophioglossum californicum]YP_010439850.1 Sec-independent protein translocase protein [Ophioglossum vulgatum]AOH05902.1 Sec-independent protein translocase protein [Ophioglossum californicum]UTD44896.1 Sec-independent protein translocase protein [Ophioglossum vulgatum]
MNFVPKTIMEELRIRVPWILICFSLTRLSCYWFSEELLFSLAKPFITLPHPDSSPIRTQLTEASGTYVTTSPILCFYFVLPFLSYQIRCFLIPSCYGKRKKQDKKLFHLSGPCLFLFSPVTFAWVVPNVWHFSYHLSTTPTNLLIIESQPRIYDYIMLTVRILFISSICSQVPVMVICPLRSKVLSLRTCLKNRRILMVVLLFVAALFAPPDTWCQIVVCLSLYLPIELTISVALILPVYRKQLSG